MINVISAHSFFLANDHSEEIQIDHTTIDSSTQEINGYYIYDNFSHQSPTNFLLRKVDSFVSVDQIKIDIPLRILTRESIYNS